MDAYHTIDLVEQFGSADAVVITDNLNRQLAARSDPEVLEELWAALAELGSGWHIPAEGLPVARLRLNFRRDGESIGNLALGRKFLIAHVYGTFLKRDSDADTRERIVDILGVDDIADRY
jgi:hypothetical protein